MGEHMRYAIIALALLMVPASAKPLTFHKAFVKPEPMLCEFKAFRFGGGFQKGDVFLTACDFKAAWARKTK